MSATRGPTGGLCIEVDDRNRISLRSDKEMLAIVFTVERFEQFVYGHPAQVKTDHKLLESIFEKSLIRRLQKFDLLVTYKKGSEMVLVTFLVEHLMSEL